MEPTVVSVISLRAVALGYPHAPPVLARVSLDIARGERVALVGGNGAGKTTLLRALVGLLPASRDRDDRDAVTIGGMRIASPADAVAARVGLLFQNPDDQLFCATVLEDVAFGPRNQGHAEAEALRRARSALERVALLALAERPIDTLSFGEKKRAGLAGLLAMEPAILLLDEPTAGLDPAGERAFVSLLAELGRERTLLCATHAIDLVPYWADRVVLLGEGRVLADGAPREVFARSAELARAQVRSPLVAQLSIVAGRTPVALTVEEAKEQWTERRF